MGVGFTGKTEIKGIGMTGRRVRCLGVHRATENRWFELQSFLLRSIQALKLDAPAPGILIYDQ